MSDAQAITYLITTDWLPNRFMHLQFLIRSPRFHTISVHHPVADFD